jgi:hypothetical protein
MGVHWDRLSACAFCYAVASDRSGPSSSCSRWKRDADADVFACFVLSFLGVK